MVYLLSIFLIIDTLARMVTIGLTGLAKMAATVELIGKPSYGHRYRY